jgi:hypothetical protein
MLRERILQDAYRRSGEQAGNRAPPRHGKKDDDQEGQIKNRKQRKSKRYKGLKKESQKQDDAGDYWLKPVNLDLLARCIRDRHYCGASVVGVDFGGACVVLATGLVAGPAALTGFVCTGAVVFGLAEPAFPDSPIEFVDGGFTRGVPDIVPLCAGG